MFEWIRMKVKNAVLAGINDALAEAHQAPVQEPVVLQLEHQTEEPIRNGRQRVRS
jgi:hypothetical protein